MRYASILILAGLLSGCATERLESAWFLTPENGSHKVSIGLLNRGENPVVVRSIVVNPDSPEEKEVTTKPSGRIILPVSRFVKLEISEHKDRCWVPHALRLMIEDRPGSLLCRLKSLLGNECVHQVPLNLPGALPNALNGPFAECEAKSAQLQ